MSKEFEQLSDGEMVRVAIGGPKLERTVLAMSGNGPKKKPSDPDPHLPKPERIDPTREPMRPPQEAPHPEADPPGPTPQRPRRP
jgi:hypothetical protein